VFLKRVAVRHKPNFQKREGFAAQRQIASQAACDKLLQTFD
jgi:hypothetical protein